jgi:hypothetical protein
VANAYYPRCGVILDALFEDFGDGSGAELHTLAAVPKSVELRRNDHRTADTFRLQLDARAFPFDPRTLRSVRVRVLLGDVGGPTGELSVDEPRFMAFIGFVDTPEMELQDSGAVVTLEGRDYTGVFLDTKWSGAAIDIARPLGEVVEEIVGTVPGTDGLQIGFSPGADATVLSTIIGRTKFATQADDDTWTVLVDLCGRAGLIPVIELDMLLVLTPEDFGVDRATFLASGTFAPNRATLKYGENLVRLRYRRSFVEAKSTQVEVRCFDEASRTTTVVRYPPAPIVTRKKVGADGKVTTETAPILPYYMSGAHTEADLTAQAERIYTEAARQQVEVEVETKEMVDLEHGFDIPRLGNGDRLKVTLGDGLASGIAGMSQAEAVAFLTGGPDPMDEPTAIAVVAAAARAEQLAVEFYVRDCVHRWTLEDGYTFTGTAINYVGLGG